MKKVLLLFGGLVIVTASLYSLCYLPSKHNSVFNEQSAEPQKLRRFATEARKFCSNNLFDTSVCFLIDMSLPSGSNRFFVYDLSRDSVVNSGVVAHGSCNTNFLEDAKFSNDPGCGCSAKGKYKIGAKYTGRFGMAYKLFGLDSSNNNAYKRNIVLHSYYLVPDNETYPLPICNSLGCAMVSGNFLKLLSQKIDARKRPVLLWIFE